MVSQNCHMSIVALLSCVHYPRDTFIDIPHFSPRGDTRSTCDHFGRLRTAPLLIRTPDSFAPRASARHATTPGASESQHSKPITASMLCPTPPQNDSSSAYAMIPSDDTTMQPGTTLPATNTGDTVASILKDALSGLRQRQLALASPTLINTARDPARADTHFHRFVSAALSQSSPGFGHLTLAWPANHCLHRMSPPTGIGRTPMHLPAPLCRCPPDCSTPADR